MTNINPSTRYSREFASIESIHDLLAKAKEPDAVAQILDATEEVVHTVKQKSSFWTALSSFFANLFGKVSDYQKLQLEVANLQSQLAEKVDQLLGSKDQLTQQLLDVQVDIKTLGHTIISDINTLIAKFDEVDEQLAGLERQCEKEDQTDSQFLENTMEVSRIANFFKTVQTSITATSNMYFDNADSDFTPIITLHNRYEAAEQKLKAIQEKQIAQWDAKIKDKKPALVQKVSTIEPAQPPHKLGGIRNGGNSCYLASAVQTVNAVPSYRKAFDPEQNPLNQHAGETQESFAERRAIQRLGFGILQKIQSGVTVSKREINTFRKACYNHKQSGYKTDPRVIKSLDGMDDSAERLERILTVMDYQFGSYQVHAQRIPISTNPVVRRDLNPRAYSTLEAFTHEQVESREPTLEVSAHAYLGKSVDMQRLIEETWSDETIEDIRIQSVDDEGFSCVKEYKNFSLQKEANAKVAPEVIRVTVKQREENKATITKAQKIYPFGKDKGPEYELKAIIVHRPGHYVALIPQTDGSSVEANDRWVYKTKGNIPGFAYYYVRVDKEA